MALSFLPVRLVLLLVLVCPIVLALAARHGLGAEPPLGLTLREVAKPLDDDGIPLGRARAQPTVPANHTEVPFVDEAPQLELTRAERKRGYVLFSRPIVDPVYPATRPLAHERLDALVAFACPGEFEPLTFGVYPTRALELQIFVWLL